MEKRDILILGIVIPMISLLFGGAILQTGHSINSESTSEESGQIKGSVDIYVNRWDPNELKYEGNILWDSNHNLVFDDGLDAVKEVLGSNTDLEPFTTIALCNATAGCGTPVAGQTEAFNEYTTDGLTAATGTYASLGTGNWSVYNTFTSTQASIEINATKLRGGAGRNLSGNTFTLVTLQNNDQITVNWTITVERSS